VHFKLYNYRTTASGPLHDSFADELDEDEGGGTQGTQGREVPVDMPSGWVVSKARSQQQQPPSHGGGSRKVHPRASEGATSVRSLVDGVATGSMVHLAHAPKATTQRGRHDYGAAIGIAELEERRRRRQEERGRRDAERALRAGRMGGGEGGVGSAESGYSGSQAEAEDSRGISDAGNLQRLQRRVTNTTELPASVRSTRIGSSGGGSSSKTRIGMHGQSSSHEATDAHMHDRNSTIGAMSLAADSVMSGYSRSVRGMPSGSIAPGRSFGKSSRRDSGSMQFDAGGAALVGGGERVGAGVPGAAQGGSNEEGGRSNEQDSGHDNNDGNSSPYKNSSAYRSGGSFLEAALSPTTPGGDVTPTRRRPDFDSNRDGDGIESAQSGVQTTGVGIVGEGGGEGAERAHDGHDYGTQRGRDTATTTGARATGFSPSQESGERGHGG